MSAANVDSGDTKPSSEEDRDPCPDSLPLLSIGKMAKRYQVTLRALRFYESSGLLHPQRCGATRLYSAEDCQRTELILKGKQLKFTLSEIKTFIDNSDDTADVSRLDAILHPHQIMSQIHNLKEQREEVDKAIRAPYEAYPGMFETEDVKRPETNPSP